MPPVIEEYCDYLVSGHYFGYTFQKVDYSPDDYPCPPSAALGSNSKSNSTGDWFCTITSGMRGFKLPRGAEPSCKEISTSGVFGYHWPL